MRSVNLRKSWFSVCFPCENPDLRQSPAPMSVNLRCSRYPWPDPLPESWGIRRRLQQEKLLSRKLSENRKIPLSPWLFAARRAYALHHGNTGSAKSWGASTPPNSRVRTDGEKLGLPHPREWFFNASESDLSDGHLLFARDPVEFCAFLTFWAMSGMGIPTRH